MEKRGVIFIHKTKKQKQSECLKKSSAAVGRPAWELKIILLIFVTGTLWSNQIRIAGSRLVEFAISNSPTPSPSPTLTPTPTPTPVILPSRLIIDKLGIDAEIEYVGADENGKMGVPSNWNNVAWYRAGPVPGQTGNMVIAGHYDTNRGQPAVFYQLESLEPGDIIRISKVDGSLLSYQVTGREIFPLREVPVDYIFGSKDTSQLILITCNGYFNRGIKSYSHRIAVFSELIN